MTRHRWFPWGALVCALALAVPAAAAPVPGDQDKPLDKSLALVPAKAPLVVQLHGFERTRERLNTLIKNAMPDFAALAKEKMDEALKQALEGRKLDITADGHIFVVFTELPGPNQNPPKMAILVPVKDYKAFRDGLLKEDERKTLKTDPKGYDSVTINNEAVYFVDRKSGYAVVSPDADTAESFVKKYDGLNGKLSKPIAHHLMDADVSVYVDMAVVNKEHGDAIKQAQDQLDRALENSPDKSVTELVKRIFGPLFQAVSDSTGMLFSVDLRPEGLLLHAEVEVPADSKTSGLLKEWKSLPVADLAKLPAGQMSYSGLAFTPDLLKRFGSLVYGLTAEADSAEAKALQKAMEAMADAKPRQVISAASVPANGLTVSSYEDPAKAVAAQLTLLKSLKEGALYGAVLKAAPVVKENAEKHGGIEFNSASLKWDLEKTVEKQAAALTDEQKKAMVEYMKSLLGEGSDIWFGSDGKTVVQVAAKDWPAARALIDRYRKGEGTLGASQTYKDAVKHLPANASVAVLVDVPKYAEVLVKSGVTMLRASGLPLPIPEGIEKPAVEAKTTYMGVAFTLESGRAGFDLWLSAQSANDVYKMYLEKLLKPNF